jgi:pyruvate dehydrogenase E2 component (dihydrolipoamide acetyltransferase)
MQQNQEHYSPKIKEVVKLNVAQRYTAKTLLSTWQSVPHFSQDANMSAKALLQVKNELNDVSLNDILLKIVANAVKDVPIVNSTLNGEELIIYEDINISVAIVSERGLFVPVIRHVDKKNVREISEEIKMFTEKAAKGRILPDDMAFGTITVSNLGKSAVESGLPILNAPQNALVFFGAIRREPIVDEKDRVVAGDVLGISNVYDHRAIDGMNGSLFTTRLKQEIETLTTEKVL